MKVLIVSDIHSNLVALDAVLADAAGLYDHMWCLGDIVGYGPEPNGCVRRVQEVADIVICGNHDWAALGKIDTSGFNPVARRATMWTSKMLADDVRSWLDALAPSFGEQSDFLLAHGSPADPIFEYVIDTQIALNNFAVMTHPFALVGHSHHPAIFVERPNQQAELLLPSELPTHDLTRDTRMILNPGSVGQPRDGDPRAAYAILDTDALTWTFRRAAYDIATVQAHMHAVGLPSYLSERLAVGM